MATKQKDLKCIEGVYYESDTAGDSINYRFTAEQILWIPVMGTDSGGYSTVSSATTPSTTQFSVADGTQFSANNIVVVSLDSGDEARTVQSVSTNLVTLSTALSAAPETSDKVKTATCKVYIQRVSDSKYAYSDSDGETQYTTTLSTGLQYFSLRYDWVDYETGLDEDLRCYLDGIDPSTALNPCEITVISGLTYDQHIISIERLTDAEAGATNYLRHNCFFLYDQDISYPREWFKSGSSTTVGTIQSIPLIEEGGEDLRNSFTVIGSRIRTEVAGTDSNRIINPNNPITRFISSKSVDTDSIYYASASNFVGREKKSVVILPSINSQGRADFIGLKSLRQSRLPKPKARFKSFGHPLIEMNDCISVEDEEKSTIEKTQNNWIETITTTAENKNYLTEFDSTPVKPEQAYFTPPNVDTTQYGDYPIINVEVTVGGRREEGSGTWADNGGGSYTLTDSGKSWVNSEWVNDGWGLSGGFDVYDADWQRFRVTASTATTITADRPTGEVYTPTDGKYYIISTEGRYSGHPYDPYWSDESGKYVNIRFDLLISAWVDVRIQAVSGDFLVASLYNPEENNHYKKLSPGTYTLQWDGVDQYGKWNQHCGVQEVRTYADNSIETSVGAGWFCSEAMTGSIRDSYSEFYVYFNVKGLDNEFYAVKSSTAGTDNSTYNYLGNQDIYMYRGTKVSGSLTIDPALLQIGTDSLSPSYFWDDADPDGVGHTTGLKMYMEVTGDKRLVQHEIKIVPLVYGRCIASNGDRLVGWVSNQVGGSKSDFYPNFKDMSSGYTEYFLPQEWGYVFESEATRINDHARTHGWTLSETWVGWGFAIIMTLTDKSGRTAVDRKFITWRDKRYTGGSYYTAAPIIAAWNENIEPFYRFAPANIEGQEDLGWVWISKVYPFV